MRAVERVAESLGNTPAVCRKCYIHPVVLDGYLDGSLVTCLQQRYDGEKDEHTGLDADERCVLRLFRERQATAYA